MSGTLDASPAPGVDAGLDDVAEAWRLVRELMIASRPHYLAVLQDVGLSPVQGLALLHLNTEEPLTMSELAAALKCDNSNVTGIVDRLEYRGLVERRPADHDRRVKLLALTGEGLELRAALGDRLHAPPEELARLSPEDQRALRDLLQRAFES
jgi:DNA-binding MarR family transcriptional regulator